MSAGPYIINFRESGSGGSFAALDDPTLLPIYAGFAPRFTGEAQVEAAYNAEAPFTRAAGNRKYETNFTSITQHATLAAAFEYIATQAAALPDFIDLQIKYGSGVVLVLTGAVLTRFEPVDEPTGISNTLRYATLGGVLTSS